MHNSSLSPILWILLLGRLIWPATAQDFDAFGRILAQSQERGEAVYSCEIVDAATGESLARHHADKALCPASITKLFTTATALYTLDNDPFPTKIYASGPIVEGRLEGDILFVGSGDPSLFSKYFPEDSTRFIETLAQMQTRWGLKEIVGKVVVVAHAYDKKGVHPDWSPEDLGNYYATGVYAINMYDNWLDIFYSSGKRNCYIANTHPNNSGVELVNQIRIHPKRNYADAKGQALVERRVLKGTIRPNQNECLLLSSDLPHPPAFAARRFRSQLEALGISVTGEAVATFEPYSPESLTPLATYYGANLPDLCRATNFHSLNHYAEALLKALVRNDSIPASTPAAINHERALLEGMGAVFSPTFRLVDGSGLARTNRMTASDMTTLLTLVPAMPEGCFSAMLASLPRAGMEGTVKSFLKEKPLKAYLKSGSMRGIQCYAGYLVEEEKVYAVALLANRVSNRAKVRSAMEQALLATFSKL